MQTRVSRLALVLAAGLLAAAPCVRAQSVFGVVEIDSWSACSSNLAAFCQASGLPFALTGMNTLAGPMLKAPNLTGIDVRRPIRMYLLFTTQHNQPAPAAVVALPLSGDGATYLDSLRDAYETTSQNGAAHVFTEPKGQGSWGRRLAVVATNGMALVGEHAEDALAVAAALRTNGVPVVEDAAADIRASFDIQALLPFVEHAADGMRARFANLPPAGMPSGGPNPAAILGAEMDAGLNVLRQIRRIALGFKADGDNGTLLACVDLKPGSTLAAAAHELRPPSERYTRLLPPGTLFGAVGGGLTGMNVLAKPYGDFMAKVYQAMPGMPGMADTMRTLMARFMGLYTGDYAIGLLPDARTGGVLLAEIFAVSDGDKARAIHREALAMAHDAYQSMGLAIASLPVRTHGDVEVNAFQYRLAPPASNAPGPALAMPMALLAPFLTKLTMEYAVIDKDLVFVAGRAGAIDQVIDGVRKGGDPQFYHNARALFGEGATPPTEVTHLDLVAALAPILKLLPGVDAAQLAALPPAGEGLGTVTYRRGDAVLWALRVSTSEIRALTQTAPALKKAFPMGFMPGLMPGAGAGGNFPPPRVRGAPRPAAPDPQPVPAPQPAPPAP